MTDIHIVFDGPPGHEPGRFVEVEDANGISIKFGEWKHRDDGYWALVFPTFPDLLAERDRLRAERAELVEILEELLAAGTWHRDTTSLVVSSNFEDRVIELVAKCRAKETA